MFISNIQRGIAEFIGTFWLVFGGCGSAVLAAAFPDVGIGLLGVSLAFGLTVLTMAYAIGHISGCHLTPAVTVGLWAGGRFDARDIPLYVVAQVLGAIVAVIVLAVAAGLGVLFARRLGGRYAVAAAMAWGLVWIAVGRTTDAPVSRLVTIGAVTAAVIVVLGAAAARHPAARRG